MILNHNDLQVSDIAAATKFFETFFRLRSTYGREGQVAFLTVDGGFAFALSNLHNSPPPTYPPDLFSRTSARYVRFTNE